MTATGALTLTDSFGFAAPAPVVSTRCRATPGLTVPEDVKAIDHMPVGNYATQFLWSDAHYTGLYTFRYLRSICTCIQCNAARSESGGPPV